MRRKTPSEEGRGLASDDLYDHRPQRAYDDLSGYRGAHLQTHVGGGARFERVPAKSQAGRRGADVPSPETMIGSRSPRKKRPGIFFDSPSSLLSASLADRNTGSGILGGGCDPDQFHDNEAGDIYDLYNACNGVMYNDLLDIDKLDELSAEEAEALDLPRLREVWEHTATGCMKCKNIIRTLNRARATLREDVDGFAASGSEQ